MNLKDFFLGMFAGIYTERNRGGKQVYVERGPGCCSGQGCGCMFLFLILFLCVCLAAV